MKSLFANKQITLFLLIFINHVFFIVIMFLLCFIVLEFRDPGSHALIHA